MDGRDRESGCKIASQDHHRLRTLHHDRGRAGCDPRHPDVRGLTYIAEVGTTYRGAAGPAGVPAAMSRFGPVSLPLFQAGRRGLAICDEGLLSFIVGLLFERPPSL